MMNLLEQSENNVGLAYALKISACVKPCQEGIFLPYPDPSPEDFGQRLKRLAKAKGLTNRAIAKLTGAHEVTVSRWMAGTVPGTETLLVLTQLLDVDLDYLLLKDKPHTTPAKAKTGLRRITRTADEERRKGGA